MVVNSNTGVDPGILRHQITDLQQDVTCIPGEEEEEEKEDDRKEAGKQDRQKSDKRKLHTHALCVT